MIVVGAGVAGLSTAYMLQQQGRSVVLLEAAGAGGGRVHTRRSDGFLVDTGAQFLLQGCDHTLRLVDELGIGGSVEKVRLPSALWVDGRTYVQPKHEAGLLTFPGLSWRARLSASKIAFSVLRHHRLYDVGAPERAPCAHQTVMEFARDDQELLDKVFDPLACVFAAADSDRAGIAPLLNLSVAARGSASVFTFRGGMETLTRALQSRVDVRFDCDVLSVEGGPRPQVTLSDGSSSTCRACVLAVPAPDCVELYPDIPADEQPFVTASTYSKVVLVTCELDRRVDEGPFYAAIFPRSPARKLSYIAFEHRKAADRAPAGRGLVSVVAAPPLSRDLMDEDDETIEETLVTAAGGYFPEVSRAFRRAHVVRWRRALPEFTPVTLERRAGFLARPLRSIDYAGDWLVSPSIEGAIRSARIASARVHRWLSGDRRA
ncbi:MAG: FAD-dependent oxidoreductase [Actinomycetota bacterium]|nr:FAD-dependent oxidoreductase [Actinomycetota bacterium]